jgi:hypothetical protein
VCESACVHDKNCRYAFAEMSLECVSPKALTPFFTNEEEKKKFRVENS